MQGECSRRCLSVRRRVGPGLNRAPRRRPAALVAVAPPKGRTNMDRVNRQWRLASRPRGLLTDECFQWTEEPVPAAAEGELLIRNLYLSIDPTQRGWMARDTYLPAVK